MSCDFCKVLSERAFATWAELRPAISTPGRLVGSLVPQEEELTRRNLEAIHRTPHSEGVVLLCKWTKNEEAVSAADWEWWFLERLRNGRAVRSLGIRIQAKVLDRRSGSYPEYDRTQLETLIRNAKTP